MVSQPEVKQRMLIFKVMLGVGHQVCASIKCSLLPSFLPARHVGTNRSKKLFAPVRGSSQKGGEGMWGEDAGKAAKGIETRIQP